MRPCRSPRRSPYRLLLPRRPSLVVRPATPQYTRTRGAPGECSPSRDRRLGLRWAHECTILLSGAALASHESFRSRRESGGTAPRIGILGERGSTMATRVGITGIGLVTPVGNDTASTWSALREGRSGVAPIQSFDASRHDVRIAAEVKGFDPLEYLDRKEVRRTDRFIQFALAATRQAVRDSGLDI